MVSTKDTQAQIIDAAKKVFIRKGFAGARMQLIADEAGINKALLHYYFRSKDRLFDKVFEEAFEEIFNTISGSIKTATEFEGFLEEFVFSYTEVLKKKPYLPQFVLHELNRNPDMMIGLLKKREIDKDKLFNLIRESVEQGVIRPCQPVHLITNVLSLCIFPFVARPIITGFMMDGDENAFWNYIDERPGQILQFVKRSVFSETRKTS